MAEKLAESIAASVVEMYSKRGLGAVVIARQLGIGETTVFRILQRAGIERDRHTRQVGRPGWRLFTPAVEAEIAAKYAAGMSRQALEKEYGCTGGPIRRAVLANGGSIRRRGGIVRSFTEGQIAEIKRMWESGMSQHTIGKTLGVHQTIISNTLALHGIRKEQRLTRGERHGSWKGGRTTAGPGGYVYIRVEPSDPLASMRNTGGYVMEHRLVMAKKFGRPLRPNETVHHIDGDKANNAPENLEIRHGKHGKHVALCCADCGSRNIVQAPLDGLPPRPRKRKASAAAGQTASLFDA